MSDLSFTITVAHGNTTVTTVLPEPDIHEVVEALDYVLRGVGFDVDTIHAGFGEYAR